MLLPHESSVQGGSNPTLKVFQSICQTASPEIDPESGSSTMNSAIKSAAAVATSTVVKAGMNLMPRVVQPLGVTENQAKGGLGPSI
jgi:hypothetical protein